MPLRRLDLRDASVAPAAALPRPDAGQAGVSSAVADIIDEVRRDGDDALRRLTARFDGVALGPLQVPADEITAAAARIPPELAAALEVAHDRILRLPRPRAHRSGDFVHGGVSVRHLVRPVDRAGLLRPGRPGPLPLDRSHVRGTGPGGRGRRGRAVRAAGSRRRSGRRRLAAAAIAGIDEVYRVGGAQAVAAMAYGTETIRAVDVIVGPGNRYVAEAKRQVAGAVGVPSAFAGPSEVVVVAGPARRAAWPPSTSSSRPSTGPTAWPGW